MCVVLQGVYKILHRPRTTTRGGKKGVVNYTARKVRDWA